MLQACEREAGRGCGRAQDLLHRHEPDHILGKQRTGRGGRPSIPTSLSTSLTWTLWTPTSSSLSPQAPRWLTNPLFDPQSATEMHDLK